MARQAAFLRPATVAVHNHGDVPRQAIRVQSGCDDAGERFGGT
jgi:hypothetical protein